MFMEELRVFASQLGFKMSLTTEHGHIFYVTLERAFRNMLYYEAEEGIFLYKVLIH